VPRPRGQEGGRPRARHHRRGGQLRAGRHRAVELRAQHRVLRPARAGARRRHGLHAQDAVEEAHRRPEEGRAARPPDRGARPLPQPLRPRAQLLHRLRGRHPVPRATAPGGRERHEPRALRGLHARGAVRGLPGRPAQARGAGRDARRQSIAEVAAMSIATARSSCASSS
jgi:hypothetical protein